MKGVQCYELFGGIAPKNHTFSLDYARSQSNKTVQHAFMIEFSKHPPTAMQILTWHKKLKQEGCLCRRKVSGKPQI